MVAASASSVARSAQRGLRRRACCWLGAIGAAAAAPSSPSFRDRFSRVDSSPPERSRSPSCSSERWASRQPTPRSGSAPGRPALGRGGRSAVGLRRSSSEASFLASAAHRRAGRHGAERSARRWPSSRSRRRRPGPRRQSACSRAPRSRRERAPAAHARREHPPRWADSTPATA
jgi:hypothetical protein